MLTYETGSIQEAMLAQTLIPEFDHKKSEADLFNKLKGRQHLILIAKESGLPIGFKIGYQLSEHEFYSWLGGVAPQHRGKGIASELRKMQEQWAVENGYSVTLVKSRNRFPAMLNMLLTSGYKISGYEDVGNIEENKIIFSKQL